MTPTDAPSTPETPPHEPNEQRRWLNAVKHPIKTTRRHRLHESANIPTPTYGNVISTYNNSFIPPTVKTTGSAF
jgi:hypothetical protein